MVSFQAKFFKLTINLLKLKKIGKVDIEENRKQLKKNLFLFKVPKKITIKTVKINDIKAEWLIPREYKSKKIILFFHGGAYIAGSIDTHRTLAARLAELSNLKVLIFNYRLAPEHPFPAALEDAESVYHWLIKEKHTVSNNIVLAGDSAGGGLLLALLIKLRNQKRSLPLTAVCISPWTDLAITGKTIITKKNKDLLLSKEYLHFSAKQYYADSDAKDPLVSPLYASLKNLPPILIQTGTDEILLDDSLRFAKKAEKERVEVTLDLWEDMFHDFQIFGNLMPESKKALKYIGDYIRKKTLD